MERNTKIILDSGAYTAFTRGKKINIDEYAQYIEKHSDFFDYAFNLDSIGDGKQSYLNWVYLRKKGLDVIPIYHVGTDIKWLEKYLKQTKYIGIGAIANLASTERLKGLDNIFNNYVDKIEGMKVHGLGLTADTIMRRYPWHSVDSFTPMIAAIWGNVYLPKFKKGKFNYSELMTVAMSKRIINKHARSYLKLPHTYKKECDKLFKQHDVDVGDLYDDLNQGLFATGEEKKEEKDDGSLAFSWRERAYWNLIVWEKYRKHLNERLTIYQGVATTHQLRVYNRLDFPLDLLVSYAYINESLLKELKQYKS